MRHNVRPFVTVYKYRPSKSRKSCLWDTDQPEKASSKLLPVRASVVTPPANERDESYSAAMRAADAVFGGKAVEPIPIPASSSAPTGRVLPCLLQADSAIVSRRQAPEETRRPRKATRSSAQETRKASTPEIQVMPLVTKPSVEPSATSAFDATHAPTTPRKRSRIQTRWVRKTDLKPGEKWKRRLCEAAR